MSAPLFEQDIEEELRLPWSLICKSAVKARCLGMTLEELTTHALEQYIASTDATFGAFKK